MTNTAIYVDGFNLYYGKLRDDPAIKWLDLESLGRALAGQGTLVKVRYFTARVSGKTDTTAPQRQQTYLRALETLPLVHIHYGNFKTREKERPLASNPKKFVRILHTEEKGSDVNLATWLILDGIDKVYDDAFVISNDSDLCDAIAQVNQRKYGRVHVISPHTLTTGGKRPTYSHGLERAAVSYRGLTRAEIAASQFPSAVRLPSGKEITRPKVWT